MNTRIEVMLIAKPSRFRDSVRLLLASMSPIEMIYVADGMDSALEMKEAPLVVVDAAVREGGLSAAIEEIRTAWPQAGLIILVEDEQEFQAAQATGAGLLLRKGFASARFIEAVETLLFR